MSKSRPFLSASMLGGVLDDQSELLDQLMKNQDPTPAKNQKKRKLKEQQDKPHPQQKKKPSYDPEEEAALENILFGDRRDILTRLDSSVDLVSVDVDDHQAHDDQFFIVDKAGDVNYQLDDSDFEDQHQQQKDFPAQNFYDSDDSDQSPAADQQQEEAPKSAAWEDDDDQIPADRIFAGKKYPKAVDPDGQYQEYLESKFTAIFEPPSWAAKALDRKKQPKKQKESISDSSDQESEDDELAKVDRTARDYRRKKRSSGGVLDKDFLRVKKCTHLNQTSKVKTALNCVQFHPQSTVALVGAQVGLVRLFQVDGKVNSIIQSVYFRGYRLTDARFLSGAGREEILVGSDGSAPNSLGLCYYYDMIAGKIVRIKLEKGGHQRYALRGFEVAPDGRHLAACDQNGRINILSTGSKEHIAEIKMNGDVDCLAWSPDSHYLVGHGKDNACQAYVWDVRNLGSGGGGVAPCVNRFTDLGTIEATSLALSGQLCAVGSNMGVINLYKMDDIVKLRDPQPIKSIMNLTTAVTTLRFNHDGQLLLTASNAKEDAIRFVHTPTGSVYKNFPAYVGGGNQGRTYGRLYSADLSPHSGYASFVSNNGTAHLFRINEYSNY